MKVNGFRKMPHDFRKMPHGLKMPHGFRNAEKPGGLRASPFVVQSQHRAPADKRLTLTQSYTRSSLNLC